MTDETIRPAMTPEEWLPQYVGAGYLGVGPDSSDEAVTDGFVQRWVDGPLTVNNEYEVRRPHALAALALFGEPFGFTREDVDKLRNAPELYGGLQNGRDDVAWYRFCDGLAARIAALLPPEDS